MSYTYSPKDEDIELSLDKENIQVWLYTDDCGNVYVDIPIERIKRLLKEIE